MTGFIESAAAILSNSERRLEIISQNITNASTPGYKRQIAFSELIRSGDNVEDSRTILATSIDSREGKFTESSNNLDLAIVGPGLFMVRDGERYYYSRSGQFSRNADGALVDARGMVLQQAGGGDLVLSGTAIEVMEDGTVLDDDVPVASVGIYQAGKDVEMKHVGGALFTAASNQMAETGDSIVRQGVIESSNVVLSDEMVNLMANTRQAEMGGQLVRTYDQLIGQAITAFTRSGR